MEILLFLPLLLILMYVLLIRPQQQRVRQQQALLSSIDVGDEASEVKPVMLRHVALGNRDKACEPRFRSEEIVITVVALAFGHIITDRQQFAAGVVQKADVHIRVLLCFFGEIV